MSRNKSFRICILAIIAALSLPGLAADLPRVRPEVVGLSTERLGRIGEVMQRYVDEGRLGGAVTLVARDGKVAYLQAFGKLDPTTGAPMPTDAIFRIASQTEAVTSVAVMILFEEGKLLLGDPVSKYIPEFKATTVAVPDGIQERARLQDRPGQASDHHPRPSDPHGRHLLRRRSGQGPLQVGRPPGLVPGRQARARRRLHEKAGRAALRRPAGGEVGLRLQRRHPGLPRRGRVRDEPGRFRQDADHRTALHGRHVVLPARGERSDRLSAVYGIGKDGKAELVADPRELAYVKGPRTCYAGGAGLLSTAEDYARFLLMLQSGGEWGGVHILSPKSVELMTADHVGNLYGSPGQGFGLGFWVTKELGRNGDPGSVGAFGWGGAYHTTYWVDPVEKLVAVFMTQLMPATGSDAQAKFKALVYQSIVESYERR